MDKFQKQIKYVGMVALFFMATIGLADTKTREISLDDLETSIYSKQTADYNRLSNQITRHIQKNPYSPRAHYLLSIVRLKELESSPSNQNLLRQAIQLAQQSIDLAPHRDYGYVALAHVHLGLSEVEKAAELMKVAAQKVKRPSWRIPFTSIMADLQVSQSENNLRKLDNILATKNGPKAILVPYVIALLQSQFGDAEAIFPELDRWNKKYPHSLFLEFKAAKLAALDRNHESHKIYAELVKNKPHLWEARINNAILLGTKLNRGKEALKEIDAVISDYKLEIDKFSLGATYLHKVQINVVMKDFAKAKENTLKAVGAFGQVEPVIGILQNYYYSQKHVDELVDILNHINDNTYGTAQAYATMGELQSKDQGRNEDALDSYLNALTLDPERSDLYNGMGLVYYRMNDLHNALKLFSTAAEVDPADALAKYNTACMLARLGKTDQAMSHLTQAISLDPTLQNTAAHDSDFSDVKHLKTFQKIINAPNVQVAH